MKIYVRDTGEIKRKALADIFSEKEHMLTEKEKADIEITFLPWEKEGYRIERKGSAVRISYRKVTEAFRAAGILLAREEKEYQITNRGTEGKTGLLFDCSRNGVLRTEEIKAWIRKMALMGLEELFLYTEDTYEMEVYPYFGALRGRYTREELKECDAYAEMYGIEMIPCIQTLAHLRTTLRQPAMKQYQDTEDILIVEEEKTYELIASMLETVSSIYRSRKIHLGMDEAFYLGYGNYRKTHQETKQTLLMKRHLDRVLKLCQKWGLKPMIWSDMFFKEAGNGDYYAVSPDYEWKKEEKPDPDVTLVYWDYEGQDPARYERMANLHSRLTENLYFAGGAWIWNGLAPNYAQAMGATRAAFEGLKETRIKNSFLTLWLDNGAETPVEAGMPMAAYYSRYMYGEETDGVEMEQWFRMLCGESYADMLLLDRLDHIPGTGKYNAGFANPSKEIFYQDPLLGIFDAQYADKGLEDYYRETAGLLKRAEKRAGRSGTKLYVYYRLLAEIDRRKVQIGLRLCRAYQESDKEQLFDIAVRELPYIRRKAGRMREIREEIWMKEYKPNGYEILDIRMAGVEARLRSAQKRILAYLDGRIERLPELAEERLPYAVDEYGEAVPVKCNLWEHIISASNITGV